MIVLNPFLNGTKNGDINGMCKPGLNITVFSVNNTEMYAGLGKPSRYYYKTVTRMHSSGMRTEHNISHLGGGGGGV